MSMNSVNSINSNLNKGESEAPNVIDLPIKSCYDNLPINDSEYEKIFEYYDNHL